jgi:hypothetical protein
LNGFKTYYLGDKVVHNGEGTLSSFPRVGFGNCGQTSKRGRNQSAVKAFAGIVEKHLLVLETVLTKVESID